MIYNNRQINNENFRIVDLLLLDNGEKKHFTWISNLDRLCPEKNGHSGIICRNCLTVRKPTQEKLNEHMELCLKNECCKTVLPKEGETK